ncbi:MAG: nucleoside deaminase [Deltaproteobacteria bacterium]|nr:nucleoside deaminase [Deltaproteobacteria bacterium]
MAENHEKFMKECIDLAKQAVARGDPPFGSVLVREGTVIAGGRNRSASENNFMLHAELNILADALKNFGPEVFSQCTLYSSNEPCPMCAGAIYWSGVRRVIYGMSGNTLMEIRGWGLHASGHEVLLRGTDVVTVVEGVLEKEIREMHETFWKT